MQIRNRSNDLSTIDFENGFDNVTSNLLNPIDTIEQYGWRNFLSHEVFPTTLTLESAQFYPNAYNHLIGGGLLLIAHLWTGLAIMGLQNRSCGRPAHG